MNHRRIEVIVTATGIAALIFACTIGILPIQAQSQPVATVAQVRFEVASIRPSAPDAGPRDGRINIHGDRFDAEASTVGDIFDMLNGWRLFGVTGGPAWMRTDRYTIHAKADAEIPAEGREAAVMALLAERFHLATHRETRAIPTIVLLAPKRPAGLKPAADGETYSIRYGPHNDPTFTSVRMSAVANYLSQMWQSPVADQTGLEGAFDFSLEPSAMDVLPGQVWSDRVREAMRAFGFKIETRNVPTEVTVVDRCERPSEN
jgi:uncharacterized protein (TIGR03435 family)